MSTDRSRSARTLVIEIVGPPGAGKSALAAELTALPGDLLLGPIKGHDRLTVPAFAGSVCAATALCLRTFTRHRPTGQQLRWMARVTMLETIVARAVRRAPGGFVVIDQGPVYTLGRLVEWRQRAGPSGLAWWDRQAARWGSSLDAVVSLDACDEMLLERIGTRAKDHAVRRGSAEAAVAEIRRQRHDLLAASSAITGQGSVAIELRSDRASPKSLAADVRRVTRALAEHGDRQIS